LGFGFWSLGNWDQWGIEIQDPTPKAKDQGLDTSSIIFPL